MAAGLRGVALTWLRSSLRFTSFLALACVTVLALLPNDSRADGGELAEVRIAARASEDGRVEFGLRARNAAGGWGEPILPRVRRFPTNAAVDRWLYSSPINVPSSVESDLAIQIVDGSFVVRAEGLSYEDVCGFVSLQRRSRIVSLSTEHPPACDESASPVTVLSVADFRPAFDARDPQQHLVYDWEAHLDRSVQPAYLQAPITLSEARAIARAVYDDHFRGRESPPSVIVVDDDELDGFAGVYQSGLHGIELTRSALNPASVLHELGHALVETADARDPGHGPAFTAQMIALWQRYLPSFDAAAARRAAVEHDVAVGSLAPARATGGAVQLNAVRTALGVPGDSTLAAGAHPGLRGVAELQGDIAVRIAARRLDGGRIEFALQPQKRNGEWGGRLYPSIRFLPANPPRGRWLNSSPVAVAPEAAAVSVQVQDDAFVFSVGGADLTDPCGNAALLRGNRAVWLSSLDPATCSEWDLWTPVLFADDTTVEVASRSSEWPRFADWWRQLQLNDVVSDTAIAEITLDQAGALAEAIFSDHFQGRVANPITFSRTADGARYEYRAHGWRFSSEWDSNPSAWSATIVLARALLDIDGGAGYIERRGNYDSRYVAQLISLFERYFTSFDGEAARRAARAHGLRFTADTPVPATGSAFNRAVVQTLLNTR